MFVRNAYGEAQQRDETRCWWALLMQSGHCEPENPAELGLVAYRGAHEAPAFRFGSRQRGDGPVWRIPTIKSQNSLTRVNPWLRKAPETANLSPRIGIFRRRQDQMNEELGSAIFRPSDLKTKKAGVGRNRSESKTLPS
jgi:hypothetical protein